MFGEFLEQIAQLPVHVLVVIGAAIGFALLLVFDRHNCKKVTTRPFTSRW